MGLCSGVLWHYCRTEIQFCGQLTQQEQFYSPPLHMVGHAGVRASAVSVRTTQSHGSTDQGIMQGVLHVGARAQHPLGHQTRPWVWEFATTQPPLPTCTPNTSHLETRAHLTLKHTHTSSWHTPSHLKIHPHMTQPTSVLTIIKTNIKHCPIACMSVGHYHQNKHKTQPCTLIYVCLLGLSSKETQIIALPYCLDYYQNKHKT